MQKPHDDQDQNFKKKYNPTLHLYNWPHMPHPHPTPSDPDVT